MIFLPKGLFAGGLKIGNVYLFVKHKLSSTKDPHYFIIIGKSDGEVILFSCCTKRLETILRLNKINGISNDTIVEIKPDGNNKLPKDTYINCNNVIAHTTDELYDLSQKGHLVFQGTITPKQINEIKAGIDKSPVVEREYKDIVKS